MECTATKIMNKNTFFYNDFILKCIHSVPQNTDEKHRDRGIYATNREAVQQNHNRMRGLLGISKAIGTNA